MRTARTLVEHMLHDKKMDAGTLPFLLARGIGQTFLDKSVDAEATSARSWTRMADAPEAAPLE